MSGRAALALALCLAGCGGPREPAGDPTPQERIAFYTRQVREHPRHWPALARLGLAQLDRARETLDPADLAAARESLARSMEVQVSYEGLKGLAAAAAFAHRFEEALELHAQAFEANPDDAALFALEVEALLGLGRVDEAWTAALEAPEDEFHGACARANALLARGELGAAAEEFERAADEAAAEDVSSLATWARVRAAGVYLDAGRADEARARLAAVATESPRDRSLRTHQAELLELDGELAAALDAFEALLAEREELELRARAHALALRMGDEQRAAAHFAAAERGLRAALEAGEVYTLGALARLYAAADVKLDEALALARQNLEHVRDDAARETLERVEARRAAR